MKENLPLPSLRRGACPTLSAPMQTGDGWLSRVALTAPATPAALIALCETAIRHGNGMLDMSARGNLQARGLTEQGTRRFEEDVRAIGLPLRDGVAIDTGPLAGLDRHEIKDPRPLAELIRLAVAKAGLSPRLAAKTAIVVDGGGVFSLSALLADIRLKACNEGWLIFVGGPERHGAAIGLLNDGTACEAATTLLGLMAAGGRRMRGRDLERVDIEAAIAPFIAPVPAQTALPGGEPRPVGRFELRSGRAALGIAPAFGQCRAESLIHLLQEAQYAGIAALSPAPGHGLMLIGDTALFQVLTATAEKLGFVTRADDPRTFIAACPGAPSCGSATFATHELAEKAADATALVDGSGTLHVSGCPKGCAHPQPAAISLYGHSGGIAVTLNGKAGEQPLATVSVERASFALGMLASLVERRRYASENAAQCLLRLGPAEIAHALAPERGVS